MRKRDLIEKKIYLIQEYDLHIRKVLITIFTDI